MLFYCHAVFYEAHHLPANDVALFRGFKLWSCSIKSPTTWLMSLNQTRCQLHLLCLMPTSIHWRHSGKCLADSLLWLTLSQSEHAEGILSFICSCHGPARCMTPKVTVIDWGEHNFSAEAYASWSKSSWWLKLYSCLLNEKILDFVGVTVGTCSIKSSQCHESDKVGLIATVLQSRTKERSDIGSWQGISEIVKSYIC